VSIERWVMAALALRVSSAIGKLQELGAALVASLERRLAQLERDLRAEVRRFAIALAMTLIGTVCALAALGFATAAIVLAAGETHRILAISLIAAVLLLFAIIAMLVVRNNTRSRHDER
jgi:hypothetical protein